MIIQKKIYFTFLFTAIFLFIGSLSRIESKEILTLEDSIQEAIENNPDLKAAQALVQKAKADHKSAYTDFFPQISGNIQYNAANSAIVGPTAVTSPNNQGLQQQLAFTPQIQENLFSGFKNISALRKSRSDIEAAESNLKLVKNQVGYELKSAFARVLFTQSQIRLNEEILNRRKQNLKLIELRFQVGRENKGSFLRSDAQTEQANIDLIQAKQNLKVASLELAKVLGRKENSNEISVQGNFRVKTPEKIEDWESSVKKTPSYQLAKANSDSSTSSVKIVKSQLYPSIDAGANFSRIRNNWQTDINRWSTVATFSYGFLNAGKTYYDIKSAQAEQRRAVSVLTSVTNQVHFDLKKTYTDLLNALQNVSLQNKFVQAAQTRAEIARSQYANGLLSFQDWDLIENDLINSQKTLLVNQRDVLIAEAAWQQAQGKGILQ